MARNAERQQVSESGGAEALIPDELVREIARIRRERLTGTLEIDVQDGRLRSKRLVPPRDRIADGWRAGV